ncbi:MAG: hypothetical protein L0Y73_01045, partial [Candidatus Aminicenantes bacterium]|nr:hypothetical protein [Candidatus Aminicenantes bacterium]
MDFKITNNLPDSIRPEHGYFLSYHIYREKGGLVSFDNRRFVLPGVIRRRKINEFKIPLYFEYKEAGNYLIEFDIVKEGDFWGSKKKWQTAKLSLHLESLYSAGFKKKYLATFIASGTPEIDREQYLLRMVLKNNEISKDNKIWGFSPGSTYPAVWIRDTSTFVSYAGSYYPRRIFEENIELFLRRQDKSGEIVDWVDTAGNTGKNTVETDQESSLVLAAYDVARKNRGWLLKKINGIEVYKRLELALEWVWQNRRDTVHNLLTSGFTADWGDVENTYPDDRAQRLSDRSTLVFSIYTQAKYIQAAAQMNDILQIVGKPEKAQRWQSRLNLLKTQARRLLYLKDKGYFIAHIVPGKRGEKKFKMEKEMLAVGGNAEAMIAGLMSREEIQKFLAVLEQKRAEYRLRSVSFTLIPPYPEGFFPHHLLTHPWNYQNGGEWDWIGGRVVKGLFLNGFKKEAHKYLLEIVKKNLENFSIFEWEDRRGTGRGALFYTGAAGVIGEAIAIGYGR